jgi:hypothetical protein
MSLEIAPFINSLDPINPTNSDPIKQGDDHIRLIKQAVKSTFPNITAAVTPTAIELNYVDGVTSAIQTQLNSKLDATSNAASATKLATARTIALSGDVSGSVSFDGTANVTITAVIADDSHNHITANVDGLDTALAARASTGTSIVAGNGLSGGGTLAASRTLTMGTPGAVTATSTDAVTATSHTHSLSAASVGTRVGQLSVGTVGTFAALSYLGNTVNRSPGFALAGASLSYWAFSRTDASTSPAGTWELQGSIGTGSTDNRASVWLRVI